MGLNILFIIIEKKQQKYNKFDIELKEFKGNVSAIKKHIHELYHLSKFAVIKNYAFDKELIKAFKTVLEYYIGKQDLWLTERPLLKLSILLEAQLLNSVKNEEGNRIPVPSLPEVLKEELEQKYELKLTGELTSHTTILQP
ncbi:hypothetical protein H6P87_00550 [Rickettsia tillamookensis]|uniref:Uncharacterized protein n=2 Tax=Rickettsia tillamookensis TaxID=2761623 RepID=A0A9E6MH56_9RICK|nr:hypothetical protein H6P87_00550 [Rickettsia tillamookensis]